MKRKSSKFANFIIKSLILTSYIIVITTCLQDDVSFAQGNKIRFDHITIEDGLSLGLVFSITQDKNGFLWIATQDGLNKYDGYNFTIYKSRKNDSLQIPDNWINSVCVDSQNNLWIGTWDGGLSKLGKDRHHFKNYQHNNQNPNSISSNKIQTVFVDSKGMVWIATWGGGLNKFDPETEKFTHFVFDPDNPASLPDNMVYTVCEDKQGTIWVGTQRGGLSKLDRETGLFTNYQTVENDPASISSNYVLSILDDSFGNLWVATYGGGLNKFDRETEKFTRYYDPANGIFTLNDSLITDLFEDSQQTLWIASDGSGLYNYNRQKDKFNNFRSDPFRLSSLNDNRIWSIFEDESNILWIGTFSGGLNKLDRNKNKFRYYYHNPVSENSIPNNFVKSIFVDSKGRIWVGTNEGVTVINRTTGKYTHYFYKESDPNSLSHNRVRAIHEDSKGNIWIGTWGGGLNKLEPGSDSFIHFKYNSEDTTSISDNYIRYIYEDDEGTIWIATEQGLNKLLQSGKDFVNYKHNPGDPESLINDHVFHMLKDSFGNFWVATSGGVDKFLIEENKFIHYVNDPDNNSSLNSNRVRTIFQDKNDGLWFGTYGEGLNKFDYQNGTFSHIYESDGLPNNVIYDILEDNDNNLWISTNKGLSKFNYINYTFKNYQEQDGLQGNEFNGGAAYKSNDGEMFFGGVNGFNSFYPSNIKLNKHIAPVVITDIQIYGDPIYLDKDISVTDTIELKYNQNYFSLSFAALDFTAPQRNRYLYKLEGIDNYWINSVNRHFVTYTNLDPGEYVFRVQGSNNDGIWNKEGASLYIIITPPFWRTLWFRIIVVVLIILLVWEIYLLKTKRERRQKEKLGKLVLERTRELKESEQQLREANAAKDKFFRIIAHDLKNPYNSLLGFSDMLLNEYYDLSDDEKLSFIRHIEETSRTSYQLLQNLLEWAGSQAGKLKFSPERIDLDIIVKENIYLAAGPADRKKIKLISEVEENSFVCADVNMLNTIIRNLISNAIKFTPDNGTITIKSKTIDEWMEITIRDTGIGMSEELKKNLFKHDFEYSSKGTAKETGTGLGLIICKEFIEKHNGEIRVESKIGAGTKFIFTIHVKCP